MTCDDGDVQLSLYSGGDDSVLCKSGCSSMCNACCNEDGGVLEISLEGLAHDAKTHKAGVTAILPITYLEDGKDQVVITGSYDEYIRVLTLANGNKKAQVLAEQRISGGGVWRLKPFSFFSDRTTICNISILASCMHAGARIVEINRTTKGKWQISIIAKCIEHESMNYGSDAREDGPEKELSVTVVSTSFYDRKICLWGSEDGMWQ